MNEVARDRVLAVAPHPDDEVIGCGGTLARHVQRGAFVSVVWLTSGDKGVPGVDARRAAGIRRSEALDAIAQLGIVDGTFLDLPDGALAEHHDRAVLALGELVRDRSPTVVYTTHPDEAHVDHRAATAITIDAMRSFAAPGTLLVGYEVWTPLAWPHFSEDVTDVAARKLIALERHESQTSQLSLAQLVTGLAAYRGAMTLGCEQAESFITLDWEATR